MRDPVIAAATWALIVVAVLVVFFLILGTG